MRENWLLAYKILAREEIFFNGKFVQIDNCTSNKVESNNNVSTLSRKTPLLEYDEKWSNERFRLQRNTMETEM